MNNPVPLSQPLPESSRPNFVAPPFLLVRVQDDLHGAIATDDGLYLPYVRTSEDGQARNTMHWTVDSIVADHPYGRFNQSADGDLIGKVIIIADPREMPIPAGLGQVDTWFRLDASAAKGHLQRGLSAGRNAVIVAPEGVAVPEGVRVVRYTGGVAERDAAARAVLEDSEITVRLAGMWGWAGGPDSTQWAREMCDKHYAGADFIHIGSHLGSDDEELESVRLDGLLQQFKTDRLHTANDGAQVPMEDVIRARASKGFRLIERIVASLPEAERTRTGNFYEARKAALAGQLALADTMAAVWKVRMAQVATPMTSVPTPPPLPSPPPLPTTPPPLPAAIAPQVLPFGKQLRARDPAEYADDEAYLTIPALHELAGAARTIGNKLTHEARHALFFETSADPELRQLKIELGLAHREMVQNAQPDPEYFKGAQPQSRQAYAADGNDEWLQPLSPAP